MIEVELNAEQKKAAEPIETIEGPVIYSYDDAGTVHMETENGESPWKWVDGKWKALKSPGWA